jgi:hypothetical protein
MSPDNTMIADTLRTNAALQLSKLSKHFIVLTGTPIIDNKNISINSVVRTNCKF